MTFKFDEAVKIAEYYQHLRGRDFDNQPSTDYTIDYVVVTPNYGQQFQRFITYFIQSEDNKTALTFSGFDKSEMMVMVIHYDEFSNILLYEDIDNFLGKNNLGKVYLNPDFFSGKLDQTKNQ